MFNIDNFQPNTRSVTIDCPAAAAGPSNKRLRHSSNGEATQPSTSATMQTHHSCHSAKLANNSHICHTSCLFHKIHDCCGSCSCCCCCRQHNVLQGWRTAEWAPAVISTGTTAATATRFHRETHAALPTRRLVNAYRHQLGN